jgi:ribose transport system substrate-binding protein
MHHMRRHRTRGVLALIGALMAAIALAACGSSGKASGSLGGGGNSGSSSGSSGSSSGSSGSSSGGSSSGGLKIALSNYYNGNIWRKQMEQSFVDTAKANSKYISKYTVVDSNGSAPQQAQQIQTLVTQGYKAIVIDAASPTALNGAIQKACSAGVTVVVFDSLATAPCAYKVAFNYNQYGKLEAQFMAQQLGGKGNLLMVRGIPGNTVDQDIYSGVQSVLAKHPQMKIAAQVYGQFTESIAQQQVAKIIPSLSKVDGVFTEGDDGGGATLAFQQAHTSPMPVIIQGNAGEDLQLWQKLAAADSNYKTMSISSQPSISTTALWFASLLASGDKTAKSVPKKTIYAPLLVIPEANRDAWAKALSYTQIAENPTTRSATQTLIKAAASGKPIYSQTPQPPKSGA